MAKTVKAKICWLPPEKGGRSIPPSGLKYSTVACFEDIKDKWPNEAWSIVAEFNEPSDHALCTTVDFRFLVESAPEHLLYSGSKFELFEGGRLVATGEVL